MPAKQYEEILKKFAEATRMARAFGLHCIVDQVLRGQKCGPVVKCSRRSRNMPTANMFVAVANVIGYGNLGVTLCGFQLLGDHTTSLPRGLSNKHDLPSRSLNLISRPSTRRRLRRCSCKAGAKLAEKRKTRSNGSTMGQFVPC